MSSVRWGRNSRIALFLWLSLLFAPFFFSSEIAAWAQSATGTHVGAVNGSPTDAEYLLNGSDARLPNAHPVTVTSPITKNSPAPGGNFTLGLDTVPIGSGGTGQTTRQAAINALMNAAGSTAQDIWYFDGTNWTRFAKGANGTFLGVNGSGDLYWTTASVGSIAQSAEVLVLSTDATAPNGRVFTLTTGLAATDLGAGSTYTLGVDSTVLTTTSTQTGITNKTFTLPSFAYNSGSGVELKGTSFDSRLKWADWAAARNITIPDPGGDANLVATEGSATINGTKTFSDLKLSGTTFKTASNTITVPAADDTLVNLTSTQSITGVKTITRPVFIASSSSFWRASQSGFFTNFKVAPPAADRDITFPEVANDSNVVLQSTSATHVAGGIHYDIDSDGLSGVTSAGSSSQALLGGTTPAFGTLPIGGGGTNNASLAVTQGTVYYGDGSKLVGLAPGTSGQFLKTNGAAANPAWADAGTGTVTSVSLTGSGISNILTPSGTVTSSGNLTLTGACATGDIIYGSATNTWNKLTAGSNGKYLKLASGIPSWADGDGAGFGGNGSDGAVTKGAVTESTVMSYSATTFTQTVSTTYAPKSGSSYNSTSTQDWNGTTNVAAGYAGGAAGYTFGGTGMPQQGDGPAPGKAGYGYGAETGGGGGGNGGAGGAGETANGAGGGAMPFKRDAGSGGGGSGGNSTSGGAGGAGGGLITCCAVGALTVGSGGSINATGTAGSAANNRGGGGGAGGTIYLASQTSITMTGSCSVAGGAGATGSTVDGGGGGGGYIIRHSPSNTGAGSLTVTKGSKGGTGANDGTDGSSISITGVPNVPLMGYMFHDGGLDELKMIATMHRITTGDTNYDITGNEYASIASHGNVFDMAMYLGDDRMTATEGECPVLGIFDYCEVWADAS